MLRLPVSSLFRKPSFQTFPGLEEAWRQALDVNIERNLMGLYEHIFMVRQDATQAQVDALVDQFKGVIAAGGGKVEKVESWGVKSLTYRIKKNRKAYMTLLNISGPAAAVGEMERQMSINEDVIRFMTVAVEELEEGPSAMMRRSERRREDEELEGF
jgi:small subunit ribosomal protein S6